MKGTLENPYDDIFELIQFHNTMKPVFGNQLLELMFQPLFNLNDNFQQVNGLDGKTRLFPNRQMIDLYRGQTKLYPNCFPSLYRQKQGTIDQLIDMMKTAEFEIVLRAHPVVKELEEDNLFVDYIGLAQHYGLKTNVLDLTSDIMVAAFFACCPYDSISNKHNTNVEEGAIGVIYKIMQVELVNLEKPQKFEVIGLQPFHRPAQQKGYSYQLDLGEDFLTNCKKIYFKHSRKASEKLFANFRNGDILYPEDPIEDIVQKLNIGKTFTKEALKVALQNGCSLFTQSLSNYENQLMKMGFRFTEKSIYSYTDEEKTKIMKRWEQYGRVQFYSQIDPPRLMFLL